MARFPYARRRRAYLWRSERSEPHVQELVEHKKQVTAEKGDAYPAWVLDRLGIETMLAKRVTLAR